MKTRQHMIEFIQKQKTAFVSSVDEEGFPNIKAMFTPRKIDGNCFYFSTNTSSMRSQQFMKNPKASIYFYHRGRFKYEGIMLIGKGVLHGLIILTLAKQTAKGRKKKKAVSAPKRRQNRHLLLPLMNITMQGRCLNLLT